MLAAFSVLITWLTTIYAVTEYASKIGSDMSDFGDYFQVALITFDATVILFGLGLFATAGVICLIILTFFPKFRKLPAAHILWVLFIISGVVLAKIFS